LELKTQADKQKHADFYDLLVKFKYNSEEEEHRFPSSLTSFERQMVHEIATDLGLLHESKGNDKHRFITVSKPAKPEKPEKESEPQVAANPHSQAAEESKHSDHSQETQDNPFSYQDLFGNKKGQKK
jgi:hypothetical protein